MRTNTLVAGLVVALVSFHPFSALAQEPKTVGDLLDGGGRRLTRDELGALVSGATLSGQQLNYPEVTFENVHGADGTVSGRAVNRSARAAGVLTVQGTWMVDEQARLCGDLRNNYGDKIQNCSLYFVLGDVYYASTTDDRRAQVYRRDVKR